MAPADCSTTTTSVSAFNTNECLSNSPVAKLTIINPNSTAVNVSYDISINGGSWQPIGNTLVAGTFTSTAVTVPENSTFQWRYKTSAETTYKFYSDSAQSCNQASSLDGFINIVCDSSDATKAVLTIVNTGSQSINVMYDYKINNGIFQTGAIIPINANDNATSIEVPLNSGDQIVFRYKATSDTQYLETPVKLASDCGSTPNNPSLVQTISECSANTAVSTIQIRNLSDEVKTFYLENKLNNSGWSRYDLVTINPTSAITRTITLTQNTTIQWRALESSYEQFDPNSPYQVSDEKTIVCETTTTTTLPPVKYIFEPLISTNRVCDFENGGAEFGITVDNSKSNVAAEVLKKIWINDTQIAEETVRVEAGQTIDFSSIEVGENKFFTVALEVTNTENGKVQKMIKNKDADCIDDGIQASDDLNPLREVEESEDIDNVMDGDGNDSAFGDNGESLLFLAPDDNVTWAYNEDAEDIFTDPQENNPPPLPKTGRNVAGLVISFGLLLMAFGALVLRRAYRF